MKGEHNCLEIYTRVLKIEVYERNTCAGLKNQIKKSYPDNVHVNTYVITYFQEGILHKMGGEEVIDPVLRRVQTPPGAITVFRKQIKNKRSEKSFIKTIPRAVRMTCIFPRLREPSSNLVSRIKAKKLLCLCIVSGCFKGMNNWCD